MTVTVDTFTENNRTLTTSPQTFSHAGAASGVKGVLLLIMHGTSATDHVSAASYGGVALTRIVRTTDTVSEPGAAEIWFAGSGIPQGTQTVSYTPGATTDDIIATCVTLLGSNDLSLIDSDSVSADGSGGTLQDPSLTLQYGGHSAMAFAAFYSGLATTGLITAGTDCTKFGTTELSGNFTTATLRQTTAGTADFAMAATSAADDVAYVAVAVSDDAYAPAAGSGTFAGSAPTLQFASVYPTTGTAVFAGSAPTLAIGAPGITISVGAGAATFAGSTVDVNRSGGGGPGLLLLLNLNLEGLGMPVDAGSATFTGSVPVLNLGIPVAKYSATFTGSVAVENLSKPVGAGSATFTGSVPVENLSKPVGAGAATFAGSAPTLSEASGSVNTDIAVAAGSGSFASTAPTLAQTAHQWASPAAGTGSFSGSAPTPARTDHQWGTPDAGAATFTGAAPSLVEEAPGTISVPAGSAVFSGVGTGDAPTVTGGESMEAPYAETPAGRSRRRRRKILVEVDGQEFEVDSVEAALALLDRAVALATQAAQRQAEQVVEAAIARARIVGRVAPLRLAAPRITAPPELNDAQRAAQALVDAAYKDAEIAAEIAALMAFEAELDDEDVLLLL